MDLHCCAGMAISVVGGDILEDVMGAVVIGTSAVLFAIFAYCFATEWEWWVPVGRGRTGWRLCVRVLWDAHLAFRGWSRLQPSVSASWGARADPRGASMQAAVGRVLAVRPAVLFAV